MAFATFWGWLKAIGSGLSATGTATEKAYSAWNWFVKTYYGTIEITYPHNGTAVPPGKVVVIGKHTTPKGAYWLLTQSGDQYSPMCKIVPHADGTWHETIHIGNHPGPRPCKVLLAWTSDYTDDLLSQIIKESRAAGNYDPVIMKPPITQFCPIQAIKLNVEKSPAPDHEVKSGD